MGTRCLTKFYNKDSDAPFAVLYRQFDGYPDGHGTELADFLAARKCINGISDGATEKNAANGIGCLAAQVVSHFKETIGGFYLVGESAPGEHWEDYSYEVRASDDGWNLRALDVTSKGAKEIWRGAPRDFAAWVEAEAEKER